MKLTNGLEFYTVIQIKFHGLTIHGKLNVTLLFRNGLVFSITILIKFYGLIIYGKLNVALFCSGLEFSTTIFN